MRLIFKEYFIVCIFYIKILANQLTLLLNPSAVNVEPVLAFRLYLFTIHLQQIVELYNKRLSVVITSPIPIARHQKSNKYFNLELCKASL